MDGGVALGGSLGDGSLLLSPRASLGLRVACLLAGRTVGAMLKVTDEESVAVRTLHHLALRDESLYLLAEVGVKPTQVVWSVGSVSSRSRGHGGVSLRKSVSDDVSFLPRDTKVSPDCTD